ncbi:MAG: type IV secretion system DNA-binding domain-containing protein, partial [Succinivibrio sp.]
MGSYSDLIFKRERPLAQFACIFAMQAAAATAAACTVSGRALAVALAASLLVPSPCVKAALHAWARRGLSRPEAVCDEEILGFVRRRPGECYLGRGFEFTPRHARVLSELLGSGLRGQRGRGHGSRDIHALSARNRAPITVGVRALRAHTLIFGTTGAGKTRLFDLLISQAVMRGECVIVLDPKGDRDLKDRIMQAASACGREGEVFSVDLADPEGSSSWDLLGSWTRPSEIGDRLSSLLPASGGASSFKAYANTAITAAVTALVMEGRRPEIPAIRDALGDPGAAQQAVQGRIEKILSDIKAPDADAYYERISEKKGPSPQALRSFYEYLVERGYAKEDPDLQMLFTVSCLDRGYYQKISAGALPLLNTLCQKAFRPLFCKEKGRIGFGTILRQGGILIASLRSLIDSSSGGSIGKLMLADLASSAGYSYARGDHLERGGVSVFIDEAAELSCESMVQLLNKSRGAGFAVTAATQTIADLESRGGGRAQAMQMAGNCNTLISMRITDCQTAEAVTSSLLSTREFQRTLSVSAAPGMSCQSVTKSASIAPSPLFPPSALAALPDFEYVARLADGRFV